MLPAIAVLSQEHIFPQTQQEESASLTYPMPRVFFFFPPELFVVHHQTTLVPRTPMLCAANDSIILRSPPFLKTSGGISALSLTNYSLKRALELLLPIG